jgi:hypothetical protein
MISGNGGVVSLGVGVDIGEDVGETVGVCVKVGTEVEVGEGEKISFPVSSMSVSEVDDALQAEQSNDTE